MVGGRTVEVDVALSQDDARSLASGKATAAGSKDNRNMYLVCYCICLHSHNVQHVELAWQSTHFCRTVLT